ncbi:DNA polymerase eta, partial [Phenoliferia sp. Uapishka_3]
MGSPPIPARSPTPPPRNVAPSAINFSPPKRKVGGSLKGKERALEENTYPGVITYRHLLGSGSWGPSNPLRCIAHIDIDAAYAAMEMAVQQWNGLIAVNYPARKFGITRHESPAEALKKCPELVMVHCATYRQGDTEPGYWGDSPKPETHKISLDHYRRESLKIIKVFIGYCPIVEKASIDESYLDVTLPARAELLSRYPQLASLPESCTLDTPLPSPYSLGVRLDWALVGNLVPNNGQKKGEGDEAKEYDESLGKEDREDERMRRLEEEIEVTWSDVALWIAAEIVMKCRKAVEDQLGYTCSAGIAPNKMLAKLCSAWKKPNAQTILRFTAVGSFLRPMGFQVFLPTDKSIIAPYQNLTTVQKIRNLGGKLGNTIAEAYEAQTVGDLLTVSVQEFQRKMGEESGMWVWEIVRGLDFSEVEAKTQVKSMLSSKNFKPAISKFSEVVGSLFSSHGAASYTLLQSHWMAILATELHLRLCEARENSPGLWPKTITFNHRSENYVVKSHQVAFPFTARLDVAYLQKFADRLFRTSISAADKNNPIGPNTRVGPYSNLQISLSGLERLEEGQKGIERFFVGTEMTSGPSGSKPKIAAPAVPVKREREAASVKVNRDVESAPPKKKKKPVAILEPIKLSSDDTSSSRPTYKCLRCSRTIRISNAAFKELPPDHEQDAVDTLLAKERNEHEDYHFARDMLEGERKAQRDDVGVGTAKKKVVEKSGSSKKAVEKPKPKGQQSLKGFFGKG